MAEAIVKAGYAVNYDGGRRLGWRNQRSVLRPGTATAAKGLSCRLINRRRLGLETNSNADLKDAQRRSRSLFSGHLDNSS